MVAVSKQGKLVVNRAYGSAGLERDVPLSPVRGEGFEFKPVDRATFQPGMLTIRFRRDKAGKAVALDFSNPVLRSIKFTRLIDRTSGR